MENSITSTATVELTNWYSEDFIYTSVVNYLRENGYKIQRDNVSKETEKAERTITATKFFKKEVIEVKGFPHYYYQAPSQVVAPKSTHAKNWFSEALFNSFVNFSMIDNGEVAMALPNVSRYQTIINKLNDYFTVNDLYFRIYLVNEDGSVEVSNLNYKLPKAV
ncbi:MAG: hypothetical protein JWQ40_2389 [Segetibacter sp.]|jgi:hypothetical protein|nr:hypothetical protein [Segetibacter sp.]